MTLLEIVRGAKTSKEVIATSMQMAKTIRKVAVLVGCCFGFVANRMFFPYIREAQLMILEGVGFRSGLFRLLLNPGVYALDVINLDTKNIIPVQRTEAATIHD